MKKETRSIDELLEALAKATDPQEKRGLRAALRRQGHKGGLGKVTKKKVKKTSKKKKS